MKIKPCRVARIAPEVIQPLAGLVVRILPAARALLAAKVLVAAPVALVTTALVVMVTLASVMPAQAGQWQGKETTKDGAVHMMNPGTPIEAPETIRPTQLWQVGGEDEEEFLFGVLAQITSDDDGNIYLLDAQLNQVHVFSSGGEFLRSIGREGEGPGEFRRPADLFLTPDGDVAVMQRMPGKIILMSPQGDPIGTHAVPEPKNDGMQMFFAGELAGDNLVLAASQFARRDASFEVTTELICVDNSGDKIATYSSDTVERNFGTGEAIDERTFGRNALAWCAGADGRVFTSEDFDAYNIRVWQARGEVDRVIERQYAPRVRSDKEKERNKPRIMIRRGNRTQSPEVKMSDTDRDVLEMFARQDGTLWVLSSRGAFDASDGAIATFDVFDRDGRFSRQVTLLGEGNYRDDGFYMVQDRLYVVTGLRSAQRAMFGGGDEEDDEEEPEPMSLVAYDLGPIIHTKN